MMVAFASHEAAPLSRLSAAVLALLIERPAHGYDLWRRCEERFGDAVHVTRAKVYNECRQLMLRGLIEETGPESTGRQLRFPYRATAAGARSYREHVATAFRDDPRASAMRERILIVGADDSRTLGAIIDRVEEDCLDAASSLDPPAEGASVRERLASEHRRLLLTAQADFVKRARQILAEEGS